MALLYSSLNMPGPGSSSTLTAVAADTNPLAAEPQEQGGPMGAVPSSLSPTGPHRLLSSMLGSSQTPAPVMMPCAIPAGRACSGVSIQPGGACGTGPDWQSNEHPTASGQGGPWPVQGWGGAGVGLCGGNAAHRHFVWPGWAEVRVMDLNAKVCCSGANKGLIVCK